MKEKIEQLEKRITEQEKSINDIQVIISGIINVMEGDKKITSKILEAIKLLKDRL
jgi:uncharacterized coiled-coil protein SlyX